MAEPLSRDQLLLEVDDLVVHFHQRRETVRAVDGVSLTIGSGETLGLAGESGCGKTTLARAAVGLYRPTAGLVRYKGAELRHSRSGKSRGARELQMIFQDPRGSLNPKLTVREAIIEPLVAHRLVVSGDREARVSELMDLVGLPNSHRDRYPRELSGGQCQRVALARALALSPRLIVADEPLSAVDVSVAAQILNLLERLRSEIGLSYLFVSHDLTALRHISDRVAIMYLGKIVETGPTEEVFSSPQHPYTGALMSASPPGLGEKLRKRILLSGDPPSPIDPPRGCRFHPRCPVGPSVVDGHTQCYFEPSLDPATNGALVACHYPTNLLDGIGGTDQ